MFVTDRVLDIIIKAKDDAHALAIASLQNEIVGLVRSSAKLEEQLRYERARADGLVDRLLVRDARVAAVAPSAVAAAVHKDAEAVKVISKIFDDLNATGVDSPAKEQRAFDVAGGTAVSAGHSGGY